MFARYECGCLCRVLLASFDRNPRDSRMSGTEERVDSSRNTSGQSCSALSPGQRVTGRNTKREELTIKDKATEMKSSFLFTISEASYVRGANVIPTGQKPVKFPPRFLVPFVVPRPSATWRTGTLGVSRHGRSLRTPRTLYRA